VTRRQGFGTNVQESERGVVAVGMAVRGVTGSAHRGRHAVAPTVAVQAGARSPDLLPALTETVEEVRSEHHRPGRAEPGGRPGQPGRGQGAQLAFPHYP